MICFTLSHRLFIFLFGLVRCGPTRGPLIGFRGQKMPPVGYMAGKDFGWVLFWKDHGVWHVSYPTLWKERREKRGARVVGTILCMSENASFLHIYTLVVGDRQRVVVVGEGIKQWFWRSNYILPFPFDLQSYLLRPVYNRQMLARTKWFGMGVWMLCHLRPIGRSASNRQGDTSGFCSKTAAMMMTELASKTNVLDAIWAHGHVLPPRACMPP